MAGERHDRAECALDCEDDRAARAADRESERGERLRDLRETSSADVLRAPAAVHSALIEADRLIDGDQVMSASEGGRASDQAIRRAESEITTLLLHVQRLVLISPPATPRPGNALSNPGQRRT